jgi:phenylacetate-coenzyme A ligase PaaK-like adenylate-forming protein
VSADPQRAALDARVLTWMREPGFEPDEDRFDALARALFAHQFERCEPYRRLCESHGRTPRTVASWREIPAVPTGAFKEMPLRAFAPERTVHTFRTSGTSTASRGELHLDTLELYEASLLPTFRRLLLPDLGDGERMRLIVLAPTRSEAPDSSLSWMFDVAVRELGTRGSVVGLDIARTLAALDATHEPVCVCGTAFAFVHLLDALEERGRGRALPDGSRIMETGGFKGRSREVPRAELHAGLSRTLGVPAPRIVNQYGMTELGSQFYDSSLARPHEPRRKLGPPWVRARVLDPTEDAEVRDGETGLLVITDLANTGSVLAVRTADRGRRLGDGFDVLGREPGAEARGCSIAADQMLAEVRG